MNRREYMREYQKKWNKENREKKNAWARKRYHLKSQEWKDEKVRINKARRKTNRLEALEHYGGKCTCCGEDTVEFLCFDHINNDGKEHRKKMSDKSIAAWLKRNGYPKDIQILCHNCNIADGVYGQCPHKRKGAIL